MYVLLVVPASSRVNIRRTNLTEWLGGRPERDYEKLHHAEKANSLPQSEQTLAETLRRHGYATANYGKAHLNRDPTTYGFDDHHRLGQILLPSIFPRLQ